MPAIIQDDKTKTFPVRWMSGLVSGLQNRPGRFDSATHLQAREAPMIVSRGFVVILTVGESLLLPPLPTIKNCQNIGKGTASARGAPSGFLRAEHNGPRQP